MKVSGSGSPPQVLKSSTSTISFIVDCVGKTNPPLFAAGSAARANHGGSVNTYRRT